MPYRDSIGVTGDRNFASKPTISETLEKLREIAKGGFWDDCICVCRGLDKENPCELKCAEFFDEELTNSHSQKSIQG